MTKILEDTLEYFKSHQAEIYGHMKIDGKHKGPEILIVGATHGNEPAGVEAIVRIHKLIQSGEIEIERGVVHFLLGNPEAYIKNSRYIDFDLNRLFLDEHTDSYEGHRMQEVKRLIHNHNGFHALLDIHSVSKGDNQMMIYNSEYENCYPLACKISSIPTHLTYSTAQLPGLLIEECTRLGSFALGIECGNHTDPHSSDVAYEHALHLLIYFGLIEPTHLEQFSQHHSRPEIITQYQMSHAIIPSEGFKFTKDFETGDFITEGETYANSTEVEYVAADDCYIVMPPKKVDPYDYDAGFLCFKNSRNSAI